MIDAPRLLAARSELGYVERPALALTHEPEAVPADYQRALTHGACAAITTRRRGAYERRRATIDAAVDELVQEGLLARTRARAIRRELERGDRQLAPT